VDEEAWIFLNGQEIFQHTVESTGLLPSEIWITPFAVSLTEVPLRGQDLLAVRVYNSGSMGGIWKPVYLIRSDQELTWEQLQAVVKLRRPEAGGD